MKKNKAIPQGYMTVGEVAKKMNVSVRTLQYYDKEGLFTPSAESEGGRRLYTDKDMIQLHQILSLKHLGFSLGDIKNRLISLDTPDEVARVLSEQAAVVRDKIECLSQSLKELEALKEEVLQMQSVNFKKYADIIVNLQMKNDFYWLIKHFDDTMLDHIRNRFDKESGLTFIKHFTKLQDKVLQYQKEQVPPEREKGQQITKRILGIYGIHRRRYECCPVNGCWNCKRYRRSMAEKTNGCKCIYGPALEIYFRIWVSIRFRRDSREPCQ
ncbi:MAG: MerR family transcriptional regulator [Acutalibacteraceae bacterium]